MTRRSSTRDATAGSCSRSTRAARPARCGAGSGGGGRRSRRACDDATPCRGARLRFPSQWGPDRAWSERHHRRDGRVRVAGSCRALSRERLAMGWRRPPSRSPSAGRRAGGGHAAPPRDGADPGRVVAGGKPLGGVRMMASASRPGALAHAFSQPDGRSPQRVTAREVAFIATTYDVVSRRVRREGGARNDVVVEVRGLGGSAGRSRASQARCRGRGLLRADATAAGPTARSDRDGQYAFRGSPTVATTRRGQDEIARSCSERRSRRRREDKVVDSRWIRLAPSRARRRQEGTPVAGVFVVAARATSSLDHGRQGPLSLRRDDRRRHVSPGGVSVGAAQQVSYPPPTARLPGVAVRDATTVLEDVVLTIDRPDLVIAAASSTRPAAAWPMRS